MSQPFLDRPWLWLAFAPLLLAGCGSGISERLYPVSGRVTFDGKALSAGSISFRPDAEKGNETLHHPTSAIDRTGRYELFTAGRPGAPAGAYKVVVFANEDQDDAKAVHPGMPKSIIPTHYNDPSTTPISLKVTKDAQGGAYDLQLKK
jgi:hypothetical protein